MENASNTLNGGMPQMTVQLAIKRRKNYWPKSVNLQLRLTLKKHYLNLSREKVARIYKRLDFKAIATGHHTSRANKKHDKYSYHLRNLKIDHPNRVWATDITWIMMKTGFLYLSVIIEV